ncbi:MAG TPA: MSMEG_0565 family glycosyltransferase, partial [Humisphaera sp.]
MYTVGRPLHIGLFTHSVNPRGGVVHCLELGEALAARGHDVTVHAPAEPGARFFRRARGVRQVLVPCAPAPAVGGLSALVRQRLVEYADFARDGAADYDVHHAHDGLSGGALAALAAEGAIGGFVRTVHHLDAFDDPFLRDTQDRSVTAAARVLCVSRHWQQKLHDRYGVPAAVVGNGVNTARFTPHPCLDDHQLRDRLMAEGGRAPVYLAVGGVERRKNTLAALRAFLLIRRSRPRAMLVVAGGASLLDHSAYRAEFDEALAAAGAEAAAAVVVTGPLPDDQMAAAYRLADALVFPSTTEGFGLAVLEALACGTPVVASRAAPFTEYLTDADALLVDPQDVGAIAGAMRRATDPAVRA